MSRCWDRRSWLAAGALGLTRCGSRQPAPLRGRAFVACEGNHSLAVIDLNTFSYRRTIDLGGALSRLQIAGEKGLVYVLSASEPALYAIDGHRMEVHKKLSLPGEALTMVLSPRGSLWCLLRNRPALIGIDETLSKVAATIHLPAEPVSFDLHGQQAAVALKDGSLVFANLVSLKAGPPLSLNTELGGVRYRADGKLALVADRQERRMLLVDTQTRQLITQLPLAIRPDNLCVSGDGGQMFVTGPGRDAVAIIYPYRAEVGSTQLSGRAPGAMAASTGPDYLFVANPAAGSVSIFGIDTQRVLAVTGVGADPCCIVITPDQQYALVLNRGSGDMAVIRLAAIAPGRAKSAPLFTMIPVGTRPFDAVVLGDA